MRLIDADALIEFIDPGHLRHPDELAFSELDVVNMLNHAPTAYDVEKVVDVLEDFKDMELIDGTPAHGINEYKRICKCIEIVKSGAKQCGVYTKLRSVRKGNCI